MWQAGSVFHAEPNAWEAHGIWGQTFSGLVDGGLFRVMYPSRNTEGVGTINLASRPWDQPYRQGFWISAPNGPSLALALRRFETFHLDMAFTARGDWRLIWNFQGPIGPDRSAADATISPQMWRNMAALSVKGDAWTLDSVDADGAGRELAKGSIPPYDDCRVRLVQTETAVEIDLNDARLCNMPLPATGGGIGLLAEKGAYLHVTRFELDAPGKPCPWYLLPLEGLLGAGQQVREWRPQEAGFRYKTGYTATFEGARAKWSFRGSEVRLWSPRGPEFGEAEVFLDGKSMARVQLHADAPRDSEIVWRSGSLVPGPHALMVARVDGALPVDGVEFVP